MISVEAAQANLLDGVAPLAAESVALAAAAGRILISGMPGGVKAELHIGKLLPTRGTLAATSLRARPTAQKAAICQAVVANVWPMFADGRIRPIVDTTCAITEVAAAHQLMHDSTHSGKIVLTVG